MLNELLDINQIEAGTVRAEIVSFPMSEILDRMEQEFTYHAQAKGLSLRVMPCSLSISSDPRLLEQMVRNLISNALKYTRQGKILLGCRRHENSLAIEVWDTGEGIPTGELKAIFEEYHQLDNVARERSRGFGLGLSIVRRLAELLGHQVEVRSQPGKGSAFAIGVSLSPSEVAPPLEIDRPASIGAAPEPGAILIIEDDPDLRRLLDELLREEGHRVVVASDGITALDGVRRGNARPDLVLADYNLPGGLNGLQVAAKLRELFGREIPVIILTGDISIGTLREIRGQHCKQLNKPVKVRELTDTIQALLRLSRSETPAATRIVAQTTGETGSSTIFVVDDDDQLRAALRSLLEGDGRAVEDYPTCEAFLEAYRPGRDACLLIDAYLPGMSGLELLERLPELDARLPAIMMTGNSDVAIAVQAMKAGAIDFIEKPIGGKDLIASIERALDHARDATKQSAWREEAAKHMATLTARQLQIMELVLAGQPSKNIAADLGISQRTVENHRAEIMRRTGSKSLPALARLAVAAAR
jgi:two-component system CheB/CheR fusion protein